MTPLRGETDEAPITLACEPLGVPGGSGARVKLSMRMKAGTTPGEARAIAGATREGGDLRPLGQGVVPVIATDVAAVVLGWGRPTQRALGKVAPQAFERATGHRTVIGSLDPVAALIVGTAGTQVCAEAAGGADTL
jgi:hypothetical protein